MRLQTGSLFAGRFTIDRHLDDGGFGGVYQARDRRDGSAVALKVLHPEWVSSPKIRARFELEATAAARVQSPHAVKVLDAGVDDATDRPWIAMEFLDGETFDARLKRVGTLTPAALAVVMAPIGDALAAAHREGVIHADLKPPNVMLLRDGADFVKVLDFGIARVLRAGMTSTQVTTGIGSPLWTAPEQFQQGARLRPSADVWPLGMMAFRALTGKNYLLNAQGAVRVMPCILEIVQGALPSASARAAELGLGDVLPPQFDAWFRHCVTRDPDARFQHGHAAVSALLEVLRPPEATLPTTRVVEHVPLLSALALRGTVAVPPAALVAIGAMLERGDYARAREALVEALRVHADSAAAWALRATCDHRLGCYDDALDAWSEALARDPTTGAYALGRSLTYDALGRTALARADRAVATVLRGA